jgi:NAD(P)-dependent dehydrogenase (short-subunit alcohol dehydrogenase family)
MEAAMQAFGLIDILINNTGVGNYKNLIDTSAEEYDDMMDTNVRSTSGSKDFEQIWPAEKSLSEDIPARAPKSTR